MRIFTQLVYAFKPTVSLTNLTTKLSKDSVPIGKLVPENANLYSKNVLHSVLFHRPTLNPGSARSKWKIFGTDAACLYGPDAISLAQSTASKHWRKLPKFPKAITNNNTRRVRSRFLSCISRPPNQKKTAGKLNSVSGHFSGIFSIVGLHCKIAVSKNSSYSTHTEQT